MSTPRGALHQGINIQRLSTIKTHDAHLEQLTGQLAPELVQAHGMGAGTAAEMLLLVGDNRERIRSEAAMAKLCGVCPIPASSGKTSRYRLNRGGNGSVRQRGGICCWA